MRAALLWLLWATVCCSSSLSSPPPSSSSSSTSSSSSSSKPQVTRTALHVARSLDPAAMETLTVKTRTGDVATLLVKKREGRHGQQSADLGLKSADSAGGSRENTVYEKISVGAPYQADLKSGETRLQSSSEQKNTDHNSTRSSKSSPLVPDPVYVRSTPMLVKGKSQYGHLFSAKRGRSLVKIDADGIPVVTGVRVPDDESDKQVWRNARVINGVLMPYDKNQPKHTFSLPATTPYPEKKKVHPGQQSQASWVKMEPITKPAPTLLKPIIKEPLPAAIKVHPSASNKVHPGATSWQQSASDSPSASSWQQSASDSPMTVVQAPSQEWQANKYPQDVVKVIDDSQPNLPEEDQYLRDRILDYIKSVNKQEVKRVPVLAPFRDSRGLTHSDVTHFSTSDVIVPPVEGEARMLHASSDALPLEARMLHASPSDALPMEARNAEALPMEARMLHASSEALPMEARMLQVPGASVYPTSIMYSPASSSVIGPDGATRVTSVEEGVRTPVLQYAHPELGVQPAVPEAESRVRVAVDEQFDDHPAGGRDQALAYFSHDIHADRSPFAFEPGLEDEARVPPVAPTPLVERQHSQRSHSPPAPRPKKIDPPHALINSHQFYITERPSGNLKYYSKYPEALVYSGSVVDNRDRPFWERIGDTIREHVQTGVDKMTEMTRPVMEPLVEATQKISHNLGLGTDREMHSFKDKLGVVGTPSVFLPALGLVAGGAALGLGAVAVGRSGAGDAEIERLQLEHKRALEALDRGHTDVSGRGHGDLGQLTHAQKPTMLYPSASPATQPYSSASPATSDAAKTLQRRRRRDVLQHVDQHVDDTESNLLRAGLGDASLWSDTPCAKRTFCQVMLSQPGDDVFLMEKKMGAFLAMLPQSSRGVLGVHLDDVMSAVRSRDCSVFLCNQFDVKHIPIPR
ncbi:uncharacterized protein LOC111047755 isoform X2 [Nilaparvata lugens]|uniref:uncharacterized protein LOC111047755 isoform X2 n=1 Tax=Nilaparvata lugens TaxID=108931 RepID=UPI00193CB4A1|nr:uncharacterized protein LOC111047755 isoform X2 [Nilaparvata lugens]